jgi:hypothetical protein
VGSSKRLALVRGLKKLTPQPIDEGERREDMAALVNSVAAGLGLDLIEARKQKNESPGQGRSYVVCEDGHVGRA